MDNSGIFFYFGLYGPWGSGPNWGSVPKNRPVKQEQMLNAARNECGSV